MYEENYVFKRFYIPFIDSWVLFLHLLLALFSNTRLGPRVYPHTLPLSSDCSLWSQNPVIPHPLNLTSTEIFGLR